MPNDRTQTTKSRRYPQVSDRSTWDIAYWLREASEGPDMFGRNDEAADLIDRLRAALQRIVDEGPPAQYERIAREALK